MASNYHNDVLLVRACIACDRAVVIHSFIAHFLCHGSICANTLGLYGYITHLFNSCVHLNLRPAALTSSSMAHFGSMSWQPLRKWFPLTATMTKNTTYTVGIFWDDPIVIQVCVRNCRMLTEGFSTS